MIANTYNQNLEDAIHVFYDRSRRSDEEFMDSCQILVDSGFWLSDEVIGETCLFLIESGNLLLPEEDQVSPDGEFIILGTPRKNVVN